MKNLSASRLLIAGASTAIMVAAPVIAGRAQEPRRLAQPDSVPLDLVTALVAGGGLGGDPQILVGSLPGWIANRVYMPSNGRVLGSAFQGSTVVGVVSLPDPPEIVIADYTRELAKRGWRVPPPMPSYGGGFRPATTSSLTGPSTRLVLCGEQQMLTVSAARRRGATTEVVIRVAPATNYSTCNPPPTPVGMTRSLYPTLYNPASASDARMNGDCSASMGGSGTSTTLRTAMDPAALLDHYARQLQDSGWRTTSVNASIVGRTWSRVDSTGAPLELSLTVATPPRDSACRELNLQVRTMRKP